MTTQDGLTQACAYFTRHPQHSALQRWLARTRWQSKFLSDFAVYLTDGAAWFVFLPLPCGGYHGLALHIRPLGSVQDPSGVAMLRGQGFRVELCHSWESARGAIERYLGRFGPIQERTP